MTTDHRCGIAALLGRPNVGKSTLLNRVLGMKVSIVSPRPQTTRNRIMGVYTADGVQVAFVDTPGIGRRDHEQRALHHRMIRAAQSALADVDVAVLLIDPRKEADPEHNGRLLEALESAGVPAVAALNKIDRVRDRSALLPVLAAYHETGRFAALVPISARTGDGVDALIGEIRQRLPVGEPLFPADMVTDSSERFLCSEIIREKVFRRTSQEIPYASAVEIERYDEEQRPRLVRIFARVLVEKDSQRGIIVGKGGAMLRTIGSEARHDIERLIGARVYLELHVSVARDWSHRASAVERLGHFEEEP